MFLQGTTPLMAACGRRDLEVSSSIVQILLEQGASACTPPSSLLGEGLLCSRLGLSRTAPIKKAASQPELLRLLIDAGVVLDTHVVVYAVEDWCDEIAGHLGEAWAPEIDSTESERAKIMSPYAFGGARVAKEVADLLGSAGGGDEDDGDEDSETKGDNAAATNDADSALLSLGANPFAAFSSQIAAALQEVLDMGGDVNAADTTGT